MKIKTLYDEIKDICILNSREFLKMDIKLKYKYLDKETTRKDYIGYFNHFLSFDPMELSLTKIIQSLNDNYLELIDDGNNKDDLIKLITINLLSNVIIIRANIIYDSGNLLIHTQSFSIEQDIHSNFN